MNKYVALFSVFVFLFCAGDLSAAKGKKEKTRGGADPVPFGQPEHTVQNKGAESLDNRIALGVLSAYGKVTVGSSACVVDKVIAGGLAAKGGLEVGDIIVGVNGKKIEGTFSLREGDGGSGPQEALGFGIENALAEKSHKLKLTVKRGGAEKELTIQLPSDLKPFSPTYPFDCERSDDMLEALVDKLLEKKGENENIGGGVQTSTAGLGILGSYNLKHSPHLRDMATYFVNEVPAVGGLPAWGLNYGTTYLCEYYLATNEKFVLPAIEKRLLIHEDWISPEGKVGHGKEVGYHGAGINIIGAHHFMNFGLISRCGIKVKEEPWNNVEKHIIRCQAETGQVGYIGASGWGQTSGISGMAALGFMFHDKMDLAMKTTNCWVDADGNPSGLKSVWNSHANSSFGPTWSSAAMAALRINKSLKKKGVDKTEGYRVYMDYWKWYMSLGQAPEGSNIVRYFIPSEGNTGGDGYLNYDLINHASHTMFLASAKQALFVHGNTKQNWYNKRELLRRAGLLDKVDRLTGMITRLEKESKYRAAYAKLMELKEIDPENDFMYEKPRDWGILANNEINRTLPAIADKNYYFGSKILDAVLKKFGPEISVRGVFFEKQISVSPIAKKQIIDGPKVEAIIRDVDNKRINLDVGIAKLTELLRPHMNTGFYRDYNRFIGKWKSEMEAGGAVKEVIKES